MPTEEALRKNRKTISAPTFWMAILQEFKRFETAALRKSFRHQRNVRRETFPQMQTSEAVWNTLKVPALSQEAKLVC